MKNKPSRLLRRVVIHILHRMTAQAFGVPMDQKNNRIKERGKGSITGIGNDSGFEENDNISAIDPLCRYAMFTRQHISMLSESELGAVQKRMYHRAYVMGRRIRKVLLIRNDRKAQKVLFWLYECIGIQLQGKCPGAVQVTRCYFSHFYTPDMCRIMSAMDQGIFAGIFGNGTLEFTQRITQGHACCEAVFER